MAINTVKYTYGEELANAISHISGAVLSAVALVFMVIFSANNGTTTHIMSSIIFGSSMIILYTLSGLMHWLPVGKTKRLFRKFDQIGIFLLIAGSYTPFVLIAIKGSLGWIVFGVEWGLAIIGIIVKSLEKNEDIDKKVSIYYIILYLIMGWLLVVDLKHLIVVLSISGFAFLLAGGLFYSIGVIFFRMHNVKYHHLVWHIFVLLGTAMHVIAVYYYVLPISIEN